MELKPEEIRKIAESEIDFNKLNEICEHLKDALHEILNSCGLYHRIFSRVKAPSSIALKLSDPKYSDDKGGKRMQDLIGLRIVLYFHDDMKICQNLLENIFVLAGDWSRTNYRPEEFKATKTNGVFQIPAEYFNIYTKKLWSLPIDTTFEIQLRTVFFEGWLEIEHDMRYKSSLPDEIFWEGSEEFPRVLNCILANLELCDWSLVELYEQLGYTHYKKKNWELMLRSHFRIRLSDEDPLDESVVRYFNGNTSVAKKFYKMPRLNLINSLLRYDTDDIDSNMIVYCLNEDYIHDDVISEIYSDFTPSKYEKSYQKKTLSCLTEDTLFKMDLPLIHRESRGMENEFETAASFIYRWARFKFENIFPDIPSKLSTYSGSVPGYRIETVYHPEEFTFSMNLEHIDSSQPGTIWHTESSVKKGPDSKLCFHQRTRRNSPMNVSGQVSFVKPSYLSDISAKIGLEDVIRLGTRPVVVHDEKTFSVMKNVITSRRMTLPAVIIAMDTEKRKAYEETKAPRSTGLSQNQARPYPEICGNMDLYSVNGMRLAKVTGLYSHVFLLDSSYIEALASLAGAGSTAIDGSVVIVWPDREGTSFEIYTRNMIYDTAFDFNKPGLSSEDLHEKAFRHKLTQLIKDHNVM